MLLAIACSTRHPRHVVFFYYKESAREIERLKSDLEKLQRNSKLRRWTWALAGARACVNRLIQANRLVLSVQVLRTLLTDLAGIRLLIWIVLRPDVNRLVLVDAARIIAARNAKVLVDSRMERVVFIPYLAENHLELRAVPITKVPGLRSVIETDKIISAAIGRDIVNVTLILPPDLETEGIWLGKSVQVNNIFSEIEKIPFLILHLIFGTTWKTLISGQRRDSAS